MRILVAGALGEVGRTVSVALSASGHEVVGVSSRAPVHGAPVIGMAEARDLVAQGRVQAVLNAAGRGDRRSSERTGLDASARLAPVIQSSGTPAVLLSTMRVLEGYDGAVAEDAPAHPNTAYGEANAEGERRWLEAAGPTASVLRIANYFCTPSAVDSPQALLLPWSLVTEALTTGSIAVRSGPQTTREFVSAGDVAAAVVTLVADRPASRVCATVPGWLASLGELVAATRHGFELAGRPAPEVSFGEEGRAHAPSSPGWLADKGWIGSMDARVVADAIARWLAAGVLD